MSAVARLFPLSTIATALGRTPRALQLRFVKVEPAGHVFVRGQRAAVYSLDQFRTCDVRELDRIAEARGFRNAEHLLADPPRRFCARDANGNEVPLSKIAPAQIDRANRFRSALALTLHLRNQIDGDPECRQRALIAFRKVVNASEKTWDRWLKRVLQRDAGEERFDDLTLYLNEVVTLKPEARQTIAVAMTAAERTVMDVLNGVKQPSKPSLQEVALIWTVACEFVAQQVARGERQKRVQRRLFELLNTSPVALCRTERGLKESIKRKYQRWWQGGQILTALEDQRPGKSGWHRAPIIAGADRNKLIGHTRLNAGGRLSQGYRELREHGELSAELTMHYIDNPVSKSYVPKSIRAAITPDVNRLAAYHLGAREHKLRGAYHTRDWSDVAAGDWMQSDDLTSPVYFHKTTERGFELTRGQLLPMIDVRTTMILGFVLIAEKNYNSLAIRSLITKVCSEHGLPRRGFSFERGIWKSSNLLSGRSGLDLNEVADTGLRRLGMQLKHALLPRAKVIERTIGQLQDLMESLPGYCGRNEIIEKHERFQRARRDVEAGRADPSQYFFSTELITEHYARICDEYNETPQQGRKLDGLSPKQGWEQLQNVEPRARFNAATHYFLASDVRRLKVRRNGLTITVGKQCFNYKGQETGRRLGDVVLAWFNPQTPDSLACTTDSGGSGLFVVERSHDLPAYDASPEQMHAENARVAAHNAPARELYHTVKNSLPDSLFRGQVLDRAGLRLGQEIETQQKKISARRQEEALLVGRINRRARSVGIDPNTVATSSQALQALDEFAAAEADLDRQLQKEPNA